MKFPLINNPKPADINKRANRSPLEHPRNPVKIRKTGDHGSQTRHVGIHRLLIKSNILNP